jgi:hypothetical protein
VNVGHNQILQFVETIGGPDSRKYEPSCGSVFGE